MSCRRICGGAGGARHADARPSTRDLAPPAPRLRRGRKTQPVHKAPGCLVHKFHETHAWPCAGGSGSAGSERVRVARRSRRAWSSRVLSLSARVPACVAPLHPSRLRMVHCSPHRCSRARVIAGNLRMRLPTREPRSRRGGHPCSRGSAWPVHVAVSSVGAECCSPLFGSSLLTARARCPQEREVTISTTDSNDDAARITRRDGTAVRGRHQYPNFLPLTFTS
jgi:hypothetical protein